MQKTIKQDIYILFFLLSYQLAIGQNLIPNPGFEDVNVCKTYKEECSPAAWRAAELKCFLYYEHLHAREIENRPKEGQRYIALRVFNRRKAEDRSFAQAPLLCPLQKGKTYRLSFYVHTQVFMVQELGVLFADSISIYKKNRELFTKKNVVPIVFPKKINQKTWVKATVDYTARGNEKAIMIGNFLPDSSTTLTKLIKTKKGLPNRVYYGFDSFILTPLDEDGHDPLCDLAFNQQQIYKDSVRHFRQHQSTLAKLKKDPVPQTDTVAIVSTQRDTISSQKKTQLIQIEQVFTLSSLQFEFNSSQIAPASYLGLDSLVHFLQEHPQQKLSVTGHTDNVGSSNFNQRLSTARAHAVKTYLVNKGIATERISAIGQGDRMPVSSNDTSEGRSRNRRVEFLIE